MAVHNNNYKLVSHASRARAWFFAVLLLAVSVHCNAQFSQVISIGDSLSDNGNTDDETLGFFPGANYFDGRFSNGQVWNELLALELELPLLQPSSGSGSNYAFGGAYTSFDDVYTFLVIFEFTIPSAISQIYDYLANVSNTADADALYTVTIGGNDILDAGNVLSAFANQAEIDSAKQELRNIAGSLLIPLQQLLSNIDSNGSAKLLLLNAPNVGVAPRAIIDGKQAIFEQLSQAYNQGLQDVVTALNDPRIITVDFYSLTTQIVANPSDYGLSNVAEQCYDSNTGSICSNPDDYLFWDDIHPTTIGHTLLMLEVAEVLFAQPLNVPLHSVTVAILLICFSVLVKMARRA